MLTRTAEYALRAVLFLADRGEPASVDLIAERLDVPRNYLSKTLHRLDKEGVLASTRARAAASGWPCTRIACPSCAWSSRSTRSPGSAAACSAGPNAATRTPAPRTINGRR
jgi:hypothetical protein